MACLCGKASSPFPQKRSRLPEALAQIMAVWPEPGHQKKQGHSDSEAYHKLPVFLHAFLKKREIGNGCRHVKEPEHVRDDKIFAERDPVVQNRMNQMQFFGSPGLPKAEIPEDKGQNIRQSATHVFGQKSVSRKCTCLSWIFITHRITEEGYISDAEEGTVLRPGPLLSPALISVRGTRHLLQSAKDPSLPVKREGNNSHLRCGLPTMKFVCPKMKWVYDKETGKSRRVCHCDNPCTESSCRNYPAHYGNGC